MGKEGKFIGGVEAATVPLTGAAVAFPDPVGSGDGGGEIYGNLFPSRAR